jgi:hypothetical protein
LDRHAHAGSTAPFAVVLAAPGARLPAARPGLLVGRVEHDGQVQVDVAFGPDANGSTGADLYERRYYVSARDDALAVQTPGEQYHRFDFGKPVWVRENIDARLAEAAG